MAKLILAKNQDIYQKPFIFSSTGITVYSIEEAAFHLFKYWKVSFSDFNSPEFYQWAKNNFNLAGYNFILSDKPSNNYINFMVLTELFTSEELYKLKQNLVKWEDTSLWLRLKERGDKAFYNKNYFSSLNFYLKAASISDNYKIYNNIGLCYKYLEKNNQALKYLEKAYLLNSTDEKILVNLIETYILENMKDKALELLKENNNMIPEDEVVYFQGCILSANGNYKKALEKFNLASKINFKKIYLFAYVDLCVIMRLYSDAEIFVEQYESDNVDIILKKAEIFYKANNLKKAIDLLHSKIFLNNIQIYFKLASYYRLSYNLEKSKKYIRMAEELDEYNLNVKLEKAYILKFEGKFKEYNNEIHKILEQLKNNYKKMED